MTPAEITSELAAIQARVDALVERIVVEVPAPPSTLRRTRELYEHRARTLRDVKGSVAMALEMVVPRAEKLASTPAEDRRAA